MSKNVVLYGLLKSTFALLLGNENVGENCEFLVQKLDARIQELRSCGISNELFTSLNNLKGAFVSLRACLKSLQICDFEDAQKQANVSSDVSKPNYPNTETENLQYPQNSEDDDRLLSCPKDAELQRELREIKECDKFKQAMEYFLQSNTLSGKVCEKETTGEIKIMATKVRVISEILGNLTNLSAAADRCKKYISQLHHHQETLTRPKSSFSNFKNYLQVHLLHFPEKEGMKSIMHINVVLFRFMKEFTGKPVVMLDWPMIDRQEPEKFHPILGGLPDEIVPPDPFTYITDASKNKVQIDSCIAAFNCSGDIFAKAKASTDIVRIASNCDKWYSFDDDLGKDIVSIAIDCADCKTSTECQVGETSTQSSPASPSLSSKVCHGKMYILARKKLKNNFHYFLHVVDMKEKTENRNTLEYLQRSSTEDAHEVRIFCMRDHKLVVVEITRQAIWVRICDNEGELQEKINMTAQLGNTYNLSISYNGEIVCSNGESTLNVYDLNEKRSSEKPPSKSCEIEITHVVKAVAYNHKEFIIICHTAWTNQYHLLTYTKAGDLIQDIELNNSNDKYEKTKLICHPSGPIVLLDNHKLFYLKR